MQMTLLMPMLVAASATPCAWLPALQAITDTPLQIDTSNYAFACFLRCKLADFVVGTAYLEAACYLQVFCFQIQVVAFA